MVIGFWKNFQSNQYGESIYTAKNLKKISKIYLLMFLRVIRYGNNKLSAVADNTASKGAAVGFEGLLKIYQWSFTVILKTLKDTGQIT